MDRPPEDTPAPDDSTPQEPASTGEPADAPAPAPESEPVAADSLAPEAPPLVPPGSPLVPPVAEGVPPVPPSPYGPAGYAQYPPPAAPNAFAVAPGAPGAAGPPPKAKDGRPGVGPGVATGCGLQVLAVVLFFATAGLVAGVFGALWPFILVTVGAALLMISKRWRRFATGVLIVSAAAWIVVIGPCIALLSPTLWGA